MPVDLVGALVGWLVSLVGDAGIRLVWRSRDERALSQAMGLAINGVIEQSGLPYQEALRLGLRECFSVPPWLELDGSLSVSEGLRAAIAAQVAQLDQMVHGDTGQPFYQVVPVDQVWLIDQVTTAILTVLPQVAAAISVPDLVHIMNAEGLSTRLDALRGQISELQDQVLAEPEHDGVSDTASRRGPVWVVPPLRDDEVARPELMEDLVKAVMRPGAGVVGVTTGLWGAGGFGKTTMARSLAHRKDIRARFPDGVVWVTVGEDAAGPELAEKITYAVVGLVGGARPAVTDPVAAGAELGCAVGDRRVLVIIDDVWSAAQVEPFLIGGPGAVRLFTTRIRGVLPGSAQLVRVDQMGRGEAEQLLTAGVGGASPSEVEGLLAATGRWPVLLALVNSMVRADLNAGRRVEDSMREIVHELRTSGPTVLDVTDANERHTAVARTIGVSLSRLTAEQWARYLELAVFGEDVAIPGLVLALYWKATGGWSQFQSRRFCQRLAELALISDYRYDPEQVVLHDVIRAYLREQTHHRRAELDRALIDAHRGLVADEGQTSAWWQLPVEQTYLWSWLPVHLRGAGLEQELRACLHHPGWLVGKLENDGPAGLEADLNLSDDPLSRALGNAVRQNAHVLGRLDPPGSLAATLATRLSRDGPTAVTAEELAAGLNMPHLRAITALPDLPHPALSRVLIGQTSPVVALDGSCWLASAGEGGKVQVWDLATGTTRHTLTGHTDLIQALAVAPDGSWLASAGNDREVQVWDLATGTARDTLTGHTDLIQALAVAPDGSWLASASNDEVRVWELATGVRNTLTGHHTGRVNTLVLAPDGSWLASASNDEVRVWELATGVRNTLTGHTHRVEALAVAPDGSWLASADSDYGGEIRVWDLATGTAHPTLTGHTNRVWALAVAPDGSWLASADYSGEIRIWDLATGTARHTLTGLTSRANTLVVAPDDSCPASAYGPKWEIDDEDAVVSVIDNYHSLGRSALAVAPDGSWLATAPVYSVVGRGWDVRIWDLATGTARYALEHTGAVSALAVAPDGSWLASASNDEVRVWDLATGTARHTLSGHTGLIQALAVAPDGSWLASAGRDGKIRMWDPTTGEPLTSLRVAGSLFHLLVASTTIVAAGEHGLYVLTFHHGIQSRQAP